MKAIPYQFVDGEYLECEPAIATHVRLNMPGPIADRGFLSITKNIVGSDSPGWQWNGDTEKVSLTPSLSTKFEKTIGETIVCHSFVTNGEVHFLGDCTHALRNKVVTLLEVSPK